MNELRAGKLVSLLGVSISDMALPELLVHVRQAVGEGRRKIYANVNVHAMNIAFEQSWFRDFLNRSDIVFCDGFGVWAGAWLAGRALHHRYTPPDWIDQLVALDDELTFYFLGAGPGVAEKAGEILAARNPGCKIRGFHHGFFDKTKDSLENRQVVRQINQVRPAVLLVGFGMPAQERWIMENLSDLRVNIVMPVGALFDYLAGEIPRAPRWMTDHGLEWLGRLGVEPRRLWNRYMIGNPLFFWRVFVHEVLGRPHPG